MKRSVTNNSRPGSTGVSRGARAGMAVSSVILVWVLASLLVHPLPHDTTDRANAPLLPGAEIAPSVTNVFGQACINCHSEKTQWPWYSQVAPASWFVESDVKRARKHLNLSRWDSLDRAEQRLLLTAVATVIENREMPPHRYVIFHPEAKLSAEDSVQVIEWTREERHRLRASVLTPTSK